MTERAARHVQRSGSRFAVGPSHLAWEDGRLRLQLAEWAVPWPRRVVGEIELQATPPGRFVAPLDAAGRHRWGPILPSARVSVAFDSPRLDWQGHAYFDSNEGDEAIDAGFHVWDWSRSTLADGSSAVIYDVRATEAGAPDRVIAQRFWPDGRHQPFAPPPRQALPASLWRLPRTQRSETPPKALARFEDAPFYARSLVQARLLGEDVATLHETLDARRLRSAIVQRMLPLRMPRVA